MRASGRAPAKIPPSPSRVLILASPGTPIKPSHRGPRGLFPSPRCRRRERGSRGGVTGAEEGEEVAAEPFEPRNTLLTQGGAAPRPRRDAAVPGAEDVRTTVDPKPYIAAGAPRRLYLAGDLYTSARGARHR
ncbi:hypothetical protein U9M48_000979 [Paspalum notatum var. saurae]|uniref:Uncharacterized protein n=1 Tax=Paspalum notatum var. saurae TaxID=547442 RepID=A0AAQ3PNH6_PASNO